MKYQNNLKCNFASRGFVLLIVLFFMQIYTLLGVYSLISAYRIIKINRFIWEREINLWVANKLLQEIERKIAMSTPICTVSIMPANEVVEKTISWWGLEGCYGQTGKHIYYYIVEKLGVDPCGVIKNSNNQLLRAEYYRITLLYLLAQNGARKFLLQSTIAKENKEGSSSCNETVHQVILGHQMQREIG